MTWIKLLLLYCSYSIGYCRYFDDDSYEIYIYKEEGKITKNKLSTSKNVSSLEIMSTNVPSIEPDSFCAIPNARTIKIIGNEVFPKITKKLFQCTPKLSYLTLDAAADANQEIERNAFTDLTDLTSLRINDVNIPRLGKDMFVGLNLEILNLVGCNITEIDSDSFSGMPNLKEVHLGHNSIRSIKPGTFKSLHHLKELMLNTNEFSEINWDQWDILPSLEVIDFADNPLVKCDVSKIREYFPIIEFFNLGGGFNATQKEAMIEESKRFNVNLTFTNYNTYEVIEE
ncbi:hypothetical protein WA026_023565 [Henosepilachna vigintioctopunctata]|uniref:Uncharacterized protein n=1 Tax=Henosepilachna vigintioctopunctata TaxID=420089 RepID=A0AAW1VIZ8_9CUCU